MKKITNGNTAEIYEYDENRICKLFNANYPNDYINHEFNNANILYELGIRTPKAYNMIVENERTGIIYERIFGEELGHKLRKANEELFEKLFDKFVDFHKHLLNQKINNVMSYKDFLKMFATDDTTIRKIDLLDDDNCFIHGDYHLGNVMIEQNDDLVLIDMMNICKGPALYDVARTYFLLNYDVNLQNEYLRRMGYSLEDIKPYLDVIISIRNNELNR